MERGLADDGTKPGPQVGEGVPGEGKPIEGACTKFFVGTQVRSSLDPRPSPLICIF